MRKVINKWKIEDWFGAVFLAAALGMLIVSARLCFADGIWYDELFTMGLAEKSFREVTALTARDVHPPFYYYYVKAMLELCRMINPGINAVIVGKLCSIIPLIGLSAYSMTMVRKRFGLLCAGLFLFCSAAMPNLSQYTVEIRMYTVAMFLVTSAFLHAYEVVYAMAEGESGKKKDWVLFALYGILASYTHYFACAATAMIYLFLLVYMIITKAGRREKGSWALCTIVSVVSYLPWMFVVIRQMAQVKENYWILPLSWRTFGSCVKFLMKPPFGSGGFQVASAVVLFAVYVSLMLYVLWNNRENPAESFFALTGVGVLAGTVLFGFAASFLLRPVFIVRYMVPAAGCFWLSFAFYVSKAASRKKIFLPILLFLLVMGIGDFRWFRNDETWRRVRMEEVKEALGQIGSEDIVIAQFNHVQGVAGYYLDNDMYLWGAEPETLICDIFKNKYFSVSEAEEVKEWMKAGKNVWFIGNKEADLLSEWEMEGISTEEKQEFMLEIYWATLYKLDEKEMR